MQERGSSLRTSHLGDGLSRRSLIRLGAAAGGLVLAASASSGVQAEDATPTAGSGKTIKIGLPAAGQTAFELVGKISQQGVAFSFYGYLTRIAGLDDALLYTENVPLARSEASARFTISGTSTVVNRSVIDNLFVLDADGSFDIYFNEGGGASFDSPDGFSKGVKIASMTSRAQDVVNVQAPDKGIATGSADLSQSKAGSFDVNGQRYRFGRTGLLQKLTFTGEATRSDKVPPASTADVAGFVVVAG